MVQGNQETFSSDDDFITTTRKRVRTALSARESVNKVCYNMPSLSALMKSSDEELKNIIINGRSRIRCPNCNAIDSMLPVGKAGSAGYRRWKCGARIGEDGCRTTCAQIVAFGSALGAGNPKSWATVLPKVLANRINRLEVKIMEYTTPQLQKGAQGEGTKKVSDKCRNTDNLQELLLKLEKELQPELKSEKGAKILSLMMQTIKVALATANAPEERGSAGGQNPPSCNNGVSKPVESVRSYAAAAKSRIAMGRPTVKELEKPREANERMDLGLRALQWKPPKPINKRLVPPGQPLRDGPLKEKVETTKFIYVSGLTRQRYSVVRSALSAVGIDSKKIYDISFVGKQVGCLLTTTEYAPTVKKVLTSGRSTMKILENFDPLSEEHLKRQKTDNGQNTRRPEELYARRAAFAACKSNSVFVATKYQEKISDEYYEVFKNELNRLVRAKKGATKTRKSKGKPKKYVDTNKMEVDSCKGTQPK